MDQISCFITGEAKKYFRDSSENNGPQTKNYMETQGSPISLKMSQLVRTTLFTLCSRDDRQTALIFEATTVAAHHQDTTRTESQSDVGQPATQY